MIFGQARRCVGTVIIIIGLVMCIPSIALFLFADSLYGEPVGQGSLTLTPTKTTGTLEIVGVFKQGNDYDLRIKHVAYAANVDELGNLTLEMTYNKSGSGLAKFDDGWYPITKLGLNESHTASDVYEFDTKFAEDASLVLFFNLTVADNIRDVQITYSVYANPNRPLINTLNQVALWLLIPGIIVCCCGGIVAGPQKQDGSSTTRKSGATFVSRRR